MEVIGTIKVKFDTQRVSEKFQKREFVLTTEANTPYPQHISFQVTQDKCTVLDQFNEGDEVKVQFNLRGREWNGPQGIKYFNTLEAWRIERAQAGSTTAQPGSNTNQAPSNNSMNSSSAPVFTGNTGDNDDLPF
jgi:single-strand DNA-binding protein